MEVSELRRFPGVLYLGSIESLFISVMVGVPTLEMFDEYERLQADFMDSRGGRFSSISILQRVAAPGSAAIRDKSKRMTDRFDAHLRASAIVITAPGLGAVFARAFLAGFALVSQGKAPLMTFRSVREGVAWLCTVPGQDAALKASDELVLAIERFAGAS